MPKTVARIVLVGILLFAAACSYDTTAVFNADGTVTIGLKFLFPVSMLTAGTNTTVTGLSPSEIASANSKLQKQYPGGKVEVVTEGDEKGARITIPFKSERDAFTFLTQPSKLSPSGSSASSPSINLSNTGGLFASATHTTAGASDTYTFKTAAQAVSSPTPGQQQILTNDQIESIFTVTFALTVPHVITKAPDALFTFDHKTAIWKLHWTRAETLTATTGGSDNTGLVANVSPLQDAKLVIAVGFIALAAGFLLGMFLTWRGLLPRVTRLAQARAVAVAPSAPSPAPAPPIEWPGPPPEAPPPTKI